MKQVKVYKKEYEKLPVRFQKKLESDLNYLINAEIPGLKKIYLFGSCARGEVRSSSDIDLLIVTKTQLMDRSLTADVRWTLDEDLDGVRTDVVFTYEEGCLSSQVFQREVEKDKKLILEVIER